MKKKVKKQLKGDEFVAAINKIIQFAKSRTKEIIAVGLAIMVVVIIFLGVKYVQARGSKKQSQILADIVQLSGKLETEPGKLEELEKLGGNGKFSRLAYVKIAAYLYEQGELDKALDVLENIPTHKKDLIYYQALDLKAQVYTAQDKHDQALAIYQGIEDENPEDYALDIVLFKKAKILLGQDKQEEALVLFKKIQEDFPQTFYGYEATQEAAKLEEKK